MITRNTIAFFVVAGFMTAAAANSYGQTAQPSFKGGVGDDAVMETEELVPDMEVLPSKAGDDKAVIDVIEAKHRDELNFSAFEIRSRFKYGVAATVGTAYPWQAFSVEAGAFYSPELFVTFFAGSGKFEEEGEIDDERAYDVEFRTNSFGISGRYFFENLSPLSFRGMFGYANFNGSISPRGADAEEDSSSVEALSTSFSASGMFVGVALMVGGVWDSGLFVDWTPIGMRRSKISSKDVMNETSDVNRVISNNIEDPALFGFSNIAVGYYF